MSLDRDRHNNHRYDDNVCPFGCLALYHKGDADKALEKKAKNYLRALCTLFNRKPFRCTVNYRNCTRRKDSFQTEHRGVRVDSEKNTANLEGKGNSSTREDKTAHNANPSSYLSARLVRRSLDRYEDTRMYLNLCGDHFSYIHDIEGYTILPCTRNVLSCGEIDCAY